METITNSLQRILIRLLWRNALAAYLNTRHDGEGQTAAKTHVHHHQNRHGVFGDGVFWSIRVGWWDTLERSAVRRSRSAGLNLEWFSFILMGARGRLVLDWLINTRLSAALTLKSTHACLYRLGSWRSRRVGERAAGSGWAPRSAPFPSNTRRRSHAGSTDHRPLHICTKLAHSFKKKQNKKERGGTNHSHTKPPPASVPSFKVKKETQK